MGLPFKRIGSIVLISLFILGCTQDEKKGIPDFLPVVMNSVPSASMHFAFCASHQQNDFIVGVTRTIVKVAKSSGVEMSVYDANQNAEKQVGQVENLITQGIDGILIEPVSRDVLAPAVLACKTAGIPIITFNQRVSNQESATSFVGVDMIQGGMMEMDEVAARLNGKGKIVILHGPMGGDAQVGRNQGYRSVLAQYPGIQVVAEQSGNWVRGDSFSIVENWIQSGKKFDAVVSQNDDMAMGAIKAVEEAGLADRVKIFALDATPDGLKAIQEGRLACTISQNADKQAQTAVEALIEAVSGKDVSEEYLIDHVLITQENVGKYHK